MAGLPVPVADALLLLFLQGGIELVEVPVVAFGQHGDVDGLGQRHADACVSGKGGSGRKSLVGGLDIRPSLPVRRKVREDPVDIAAVDPGILGVFLRLAEVFLKAGPHDAVVPQGDGDTGDRDGFITRIEKGNFLPEGRLGGGLLPVDRGAGIGGDGVGLLAGSGRGVDLARGHAAEGEEERDSDQLVLHAGLLG